MNQLSSRRRVHPFWPLICGALLSILIIVLAINVISKREVDYELTDSYETYLRVELDYWDCKSSIIHELEDYLSDIVGNHSLSVVRLFNECEQYHIDIWLPIVQGIQESHMGTRGLASKTNNPWNSGAYDGASYDQIGGKFKFNHPNDAIEPYLRLLRDDYLQDKSENELIVNFVNKDGNRYASYVNYEIELSHRKDDLFKNTKLDSLMVEFNTLKLRLGK